MLSPQFWQGTNVETALDVHGAQDPGRDFSLADQFDCVNKPLYGCAERVNRAGAKCSRCIVRTAECSVFDIHSER